jgi:hypothetical protein
MYVETFNHDICSPVVPYALHKFRPVINSGLTVLSAPFFFFFQQSSRIYKKS